MSIQEILFSTIETAVSRFPVQLAEPLNIATREKIPSNLHSTEGSYFGEVVAISDNGAIIAAAAPGYGNTSGAVYILNRSTGVWVVEKIIRPYTTVGLYSGRAMTLSADGEVLCIGTAVHNGSRGVVHVYRRNNGAWNLNSTLYQNVQVSGDAFGETVAISRDNSTIVVASPSAKRNTYEAGAVSVFEWNGTTYVHKWFYLELTPWPSRFGKSLAISDDGSVIIGGAPLYNASKGFIRLLQRTNGVWAEKTILYHGGVNNSNFGNCVRINGDGSKVIVGAYGSGTNGEAMLYKRTGTTFTLQKTFTSPISLSTGQFGFNVDITQDGSRIAVNAPGHTKTSNADGVIYIYEESLNWGSSGNFGFPSAGGQRWCQSMKFSSNGRWLAVGKGTINDGLTSNGCVYRVGA